MSILLKRTTDILKYLGENKTHQFLCGFQWKQKICLKIPLKKVV